VLAVLLVFTVLCSRFGGFAAPIACDRVGAALDDRRPSPPPHHSDDVQPVVVMGVIMVIGIVAKNGICCSTRISGRAEGMSPRRA